MSEEIEVTTRWIRKPDAPVSQRCQACHDFPSSSVRYVRADGKLWMCEDCFETIFWDRA